MEQAKTEGNRNRMPLLFFELAIVFSVFSQIQPIEAFTRPAMYASWVVVLIFSVINSDGILTISAFSRRFFLTYLLFCVYRGIVMFYDRNHIMGDYMRIMLIPLMVSFIGDFFAIDSKKLINRMGRLYLICSVIFAFWVQRTYFPSYASWLRTTVYLFKSKNSAGQIWISAIIVSMLLLDYRSFIERLVVYALCGYLLIMTGLSQCRTALLGFSVAVAAFSILRAKNKIIWTTLVAAVFLLAWNLPFSRRFIDQALFLNKYAGADLNTFSSGRLSTYQIAISVIKGSPIIGVGNYYVDCSYLMILASTGLIGLIMVERIWLGRIVSCFMFNGETRERYFLFVMTVFYIVESLLEGYPPFGPGVSSFMYWFLCSFMMNRERAGDEEGQSDPERLLSAERDGSFS